MKFSWDEAKAQLNLRKHGVSFREAGTVFDDPFAVTYDDYDHSDDEDRFVTLAFSQQSRLLIVSHTDWASETCLISARLVTRQERSSYENAQ